MTEKETLFLGKISERLFQLRKIEETTNPKLADELANLEASIVLHAMQAVRDVGFQ